MLYEMLLKQDADEDRILALIDEFEPRLRRAWFQIIGQLRGSVTLGTLADLLEQGRIEEAMSSALRAGALFSTHVNAAYIVAGSRTAQYVGDSLRVMVDFDQVNFRAVGRMQQNRLRLVRDFGQAQREATLEALRDGTLRGANPREQARAFRDSIGLTRKQQQFVNNYRRSLEDLDRNSLRRALRDRRSDSLIDRAIRNNQPLGADRIDKLVEGYSRRFVAYRAQVIGRTEALRAAHEGTEDMYAQALDDGELAHGDLIREWHTAADERVRPSHSAMNGQVREFGVPFRSGNGNMLRYPGDPNAPGSDTIQCRCAVSTRIRSL